MLDLATQALTDSVDALVEQDPHSLPDNLLLDSTAALLRERRRLDGILARRLQVLDSRQVATTERGRTTRGWLVEEQQLSRSDAAARLHVARSGVTRPAIVEAMVSGDATQDHASLIVNFLPKLDTPDAKDHAEKTLLDAAKFADPTMLSRGLRRLRDSLSLDESAEARAVRQHEDRWLRFTTTFDGMTRFDGMLDPHNAATVKAALTALAQPAGEVDSRTVAQRDADALVDLAKLAMSRGELPDTAGEPTQITVLAPLEDLTRRLQAGDLCLSTINGVPITPNTVRMLACDAGIIPAVMGGASEVLDLGRSTRTWSRAQRKAAKLRDGGCVFPGCQAPIDRCDLHHLEHWANGGPTDHHNGAHVCNYHHWLVHHTDWTITRNKDGTIEVRRT